VGEWVQHTQAYLCVFHIAREERTRAEDEMLSTCQPRTHMMILKHETVFDLEKFELCFK